MISGSFHSVFHPDITLKSLLNVNKKNISEKKYSKVQRYWLYKQYEATCKGTHTCCVSGNRRENTTGSVMHIKSMPTSKWQTRKQEALYFSDLSPESMQERIGVFYYSLSFHSLLRIFCWMSEEFWESFCSIWNKDLCHLKLKPLQRSNNNNNNNTPEQWRKTILRKVIR